MSAFSHLEWIKKNQKWPCMTFLPFLVTYYVTLYAYMSLCQSVGWSVGQSVGWSVNRLFSCLISWLVSRFVCLLVTPRMNKNEPKVAMYDFFAFFGCILRDSICIYVTMSVGRLVSQLVGRSIGCSVAWSVGWSVGLSVCWSVSQSRVGNCFQQPMNVTGVVHSIHCIWPCCFSFFIEHAT